MELFCIGLAVGLVVGIVLTLLYAQKAIAAAKAEAQKVLGSVNTAAQSFGKKIG